MSSLRAPLAVPVEIRIDAVKAGGKPATEGRRVFRLAASVGEDGLRLVRPAPFEIGRPVSVRFALPFDEPVPEGAGPLALDAILLHADEDDEREHENSKTGTGGRELSFAHPSIEARTAIGAYVRARLSLPA